MNALDVPWWAYSPSPMTLIFYSLLALYGAQHLEFQSLRSWIGNFCASAFVVGLVILPYDSSWQILQWLKWGYLYPSEYVMVIGVLIRNLSIFSLCLLSSWKQNLKTKMLNLRNIIFVSFPIIALIIKFLITDNPVWTDWTYGLRFELNSPWLLSLISGSVDKISIGVNYIALWRKKP